MLLFRSGVRPAGGENNNEKGATTMSDSYGSIGYELVGDDADDALLEALAVSGDVDLEDLIGDDDDEFIDGDGSSEIVGNDLLIGAIKRASRRRGAPNASRRKLSALRKLAMRNAGAVINRGLDRRRRYPLGFVPTTVAAGVSAAIPSSPQNLFRPERLVIPSDIAFDTGVRDIKVGNQSQLVQSVEVPAALFSEVSINTGVTFDTAEVGNQVSVDIRNKSAVSYEFSAGLVGTIAK